MIEHALYLGRLHYGDSRIERNENALERPICRAAKIAVLLHAVGIVERDGAL